MCQICDRLRRIPDHSGSLQRKRPSEGSPSTASSYAYLHGLRPRTQNPGVGGSIPSQPTLVFSPAGNDLARAARSLRRRRARPTRTVLGLTRFGRVAVVSGITGAEGGWASWSVCSFAAPSLSIASSTMAYRREMLSVLCPTIFMAVERGTPARSRFRTAGRRKSWGIRAVSPARRHAVSHARRKDLIDYRRGYSRQCPP